MSEFDKGDWSVTSDIDFGKDFERLRDILHEQLSCLNVEGLWKISEMLEIRKTRIQGADKSALIKQILQIVCKISPKRKTIMEKLREELSQLMKLPKLREIALNNEREEHLIFQKGKFQRKESPLIR